MKNFLAIALIIAVTIGGGYYFLQSRLKPDISQPVSQPAANNEQKQGDTTLRGRLQKTGQKFVLLKEDGESVFVDSYSLDLVDYAGQEVTVVGQYSGDELFVREIK